MQEQTNGPFCVLYAAINRNGALDRDKEADGSRHQVIVAALAALAFVVLFIV